MQNFLLGAAAGTVATLIVGFIWAALVLAKRADGINLTPEPAPEPAPEPVEGEELTELRHRLVICQHAAEQQRQRADYYYDLFCDGARANAQLRNGGNHAA